MITIPLTGYSIFHDSEIVFRKKVNIVYGRNGTGKSSLATIIKYRLPEYDVRVYKGFEECLDADRHLNAVILGTENVEINRKVQEYQKALEKLKQEKKFIQDTLQQPEDDGSNYFTELKTAKEKYQKLLKEIEGFYSSAASEIKNISSPQIAPPTYNKKEIKREIAYAISVSEEEKHHYQEIIKSEIKVAPKVSFPVIDIPSLLDEVNIILQRAVVKHLVIERLENDPQKIRFAEIGLRIHKAGERCAFCGGLITTDTISELKSYFSVDEVKDLQKQIDETSKKIERYIKLVEAINVDRNCFYTDLYPQVDEIVATISKLKSLHMAFLNRLLTALNEKKANLFSPADLIACEMPKDFYKVQTQYDSILNENNRRDLAAKQEEAKKLLRYAVIASIISEGDYEDKKSDLRAAQKYLDDCQERYDAENKKIIGPNGLNEKIKNIETAIANLQQQTQNEELLADNINRKLRHKVSIELVHIDGEYKGYYNVRSLRTNEVRDVNDVST